MENLVNNDIGTYIKLYRSVMDNWVYLSSKPFCKFGAWVDILMFVFRFDYETVIHGEVISTKVGSRWTSVKELADRWGWSRHKVSDYLNLLEQAGMVSQDRTSTGTLLTVVNYEKFQLGVTSMGHQKDIKRTSSGHQKDTEKKVKESKEGKEYIHRADARFVPPTVEEVVAYCQERQNGVDANEFIDFYSARGWKLSKGLAMSDWKAAVRGWERRTQTKSDLFDNHPDQRKGYHDLSKEIFGI